MKVISRSVTVISVLGASAFALSACMDAATEPADTMQPAAASTATTAAELSAMGARQLDEAQMQSLIVGRTLDAGDWTYTVNADGTWQAAAKDGSWSDGPGTWEIVDNQFCREATDVAYECQDYYLLGNQLRATTSDGATLRPWTATL